MEIIHRLGLWVDRGAQAELARLGIQVPLGFVGFDVGEAVANWPAVREWVRRRQPSDVVRTQFSDDEIAQASWLALRADFQRGYPQPREDDFGYLEATYDLSAHCAECGTGLRQKAPFQMKADPNWSRRGILQLNWVFDEFFVKSDEWARVFEPHGVGQRAVTKTSGRPLQTVVQLVVDELVHIDTTGLVSETCGSCERVKYVPITGGPIPPMVDQPTVGMAKTAEYFGSGGSAYREVIVSGDLATALRSAGIRGASFVPAAASAASSQ